MKMPTTAAREAILSHCVTRSASAPYAFNAAAMASEIGFPYWLVWYSLQRLVFAGEIKKSDHIYTYTRRES